MRNITKLSFWPELEKLGFIAVRYKFNGKVNSIGAALQTQYRTDLIEIEPWNGKFWVIRNKVGDSSQSIFAEAREIASKVREIVENNTVTYVVQFSCNGRQFMGSLVRRVINHPHLFQKIWVEMEVRLRQEVELYYQNGDKRVDLWSCNFYRVTPNGQAFEYPELYEQRIQIYYKEEVETAVPDRKTALLNLLAIHKITGVEHESLETLELYWQVFNNETQGPIIKSTEQ